VIDGSSTSDISDARVTQAILALLSSRAPDATICPSEVARALEPSGWRSLMSRVRAAARELARAGVLEIRQGGVRINPNGEFHGPIRLALPKQKLAPGSTA